ncbi:MAG TPA: OsmC family protein [Clostridia bacterium]|nr:OsmC family protein [Clostridia bacterium]
MEFGLEFERTSEILGTARSRGVELVFDTGHGIDKQGMWPMEVLVASLGGCLNLDVGAALQMSGYTLDRLTMTLSGHRDDDIPRIDRISCRIDVWSSNLSQAAADEILAYALGRSTICNTLADTVTLEITISPHES